MLIRTILPEDYMSYEFLRKQALGEYNEQAGTNLESSSQKIKEEFERLISNKKRILVIAEENSKLLGFLIASLISNTYEKVAYLDDIFVLPNYRKNRIGTELIEYFKTWSKAHKTKTLRLAVLTNNTNAINFYKKIGFKIKHYEMGLNL